MSSASSASGMIGGAILVLAGFGYAALLAIVRRVDRAFPSTNPTENTWWFGYVRDLTNFVGFLAFALAFWLLGFSSPLALLGGCVTGLVIYFFDYLFARVLKITHAAASLYVLVILIAVPVTVLRARAHDLLRDLVDRLFG